MPRYERKDFRVGSFITCDSPIPTVLSPRRAPPRYGEEPNFKAISEQLDAARKRLEEIAKVVRDAKQRR